MVSVRLHPGDAMAHGDISENPSREKLTTGVSFFSRFGPVVMPAEPFVSSTTSLRFRGVPDSLAEYHLEGSECCLIHADNPLSRTKGVYLNPRVRVGYNPAAYEATHPAGSWVSAWEIFTGIWSNRLKRWTSVKLEGVVVQSRMKRWKRDKKGNQEPGVFCLINEMQVLAHNGWAHV